MSQPRSTQRYVKGRPEEEEFLAARMLKLVRKHPRYGYRRIWARQRQEGWQVNRKRVYRLWRREGLRVARKHRKKRRLGSSENGCARRRPEHKDHVWAWDFIHDRTASGGPLKWLSVVDEFTRECLTLEVARSITAQDVKEELIRLLRERGAPDYIRSDNGSELIAKALREWREEYSHRRPHSRLDWRTPGAFAASLAARAVGAPPLRTSQRNVPNPFSHNNWHRNREGSRRRTGKTQHAQGDKGNGRRKTACLEPGPGSCPSFGIDGR